MPQPYSEPTQVDVPKYLQYSRIEALNMRPVVISGLGATKTLIADDSGALILFDRAAGIVITLPAPVVGLTFDFVVTVTVTTNSYKVITSAGTVLLIGQTFSVDTDSSNAVAVFSANGSTHIALTMAGSTTGGLIGTVLRFRCVTALLWVVEGIINGTGAVATSFATS